MRCRAKSTLLCVVTHNRVIAKIEWAFMHFFLFHRRSPEFKKIFQIFVSRQDSWKYVMNECIIKTYDYK